MGKPIIVNQDGLRCLIDPDDPSRKPSGIVSYKLSPEEIEERYGKYVPRQNTETYKKFDSNTVKFIREKESEGKKMGTKITKDQLADECRKHGFNKKTYKDIAEIYGLASSHSVECLVSKYKIKQLVLEEPVIEPAIEPVKEQAADKQTDNAAVAPANVEDTGIVADEFEILNKIKDLLKENKQLKAAAETNSALKEYLLQMKTGLEKIIGMIP